MQLTNVNELWAHVMADELAKCGLERAVVCPGSRNTPLTLALHQSGGINVHSLLDERSASFFALGGGRNNRPTAIVTTSGTATAECHPAVIEADHARVPLLVITADRPPELHESGANQTTDQTNLYGNAVRWSWALPEAECDPRKLRSLRTGISRALRETTGSTAGPVHINVPFRKPLEPTPDHPTVDQSFIENHPLEVEGREGPFVRRTTGSPEVPEDELRPVAESILTSRRGWILAGPRRPGNGSAETIRRIAELTGFPVLADPLSGLRYHEDNEEWPLISGYDGYLQPSFEELDPPEMVLRFGANPTAGKRVNTYLESTSARQILVDPAGRWPEDQFTASDLLENTPSSLARTLDAVDQPSAIDVGWKERWLERDETFWETLENHRAKREGPDPFEPEVLSSVLDQLPDGGHLFVGNSLPVRDLGQFVRHRPKTIHAHANRGCSGIDGLVSTALGIDHTTDRPLVAVLGDLSLYHDMNGLLAIDRLDLETTILVINNDGGGIFHRLPVEEHDPPFTELVNTPHGLTFEPAAKQYGCGYELIEDTEALDRTLTSAIDGENPTLVEIPTDGEACERTREKLLPALS